MQMARLRLSCCPVLAWQIHANRQDAVVWGLRIDQSIFIGNPLICTLGSRYNYSDYVRRRDDLLRSSWSGSLESSEVVGEAWSIYISLAMSPCTTRHCLHIPEWVVEAFLLPMSLKTVSSSARAETNCVMFRQWDELTHMCISSRAGFVKRKDYIFSLIYI